MADDKVQELTNRVAMLSEKLDALTGKLAEEELAKHDVRSAVTRLVERLASHDLLSEEDVRFCYSTLGPEIPEKTLKEAVARTVQQSAVKVTCKCGAKVDKIKGVEDQQCPWCGEML